MTKTYFERVKFVYRLLSTGDYFCFDRQSHFCDDYPSLAVFFLHGYKSVFVRRKTFSILAFRDKHGNIIVRLTSRVHAKSKVL